MFDVILDTNIVFTKDNSQFLSPHFQKEWNALNDIADLKLLIPEIVRDERLFRIFSVAAASLSKAKKELSFIEGLAGIAQPNLKTEAEVKLALETAFTKLLTDFGAKIILTPVEKINWVDVIKSSVWRIPPFIYEESSKTEKGFRDRMILETVIQYAENAANLVFLSGDEVLRTAIEKHFGRSEKRQVFESVEGFASYVKLLDEQLTKQFVATLIQKVTQAWIENDPSKSIFQLLKVSEEVHKRFGLMLISPSEKNNALSPAYPNQIVAWLAMSGENVFIGSTEFQKKSAKDLFEWKTTVEFVQLFKRTPLSGVAFIDDRIRISKFDIFWNASVAEDAEFSNPILNDIKLQESNLEWVNPPVLSRYGFAPAPPQSLPIQPQNIDWSKFLSSPSSFQNVDWTKLLTPSGSTANIDWSKLSNIDWSKFLNNPKS